MILRVEGRGRSDCERGFLVERQLCEKAVGRCLWAPKRARRIGGGPRSASERSEGCQGVHCLLAMIKMQVDQMAEAMQPEAESL